MSLAKLALLSIKPKGGKEKDAEGDMDDEGGAEENEGLQEALGEAFDALKSNDKEAFTEALKNALECM
jgi:hypothetical protein